MEKEATFCLLVRFPDCSRPKPGIKASDQDSSSDLSLLPAQASRERPGRKLALIRMWAPHGCHSAHPTICFGVNYDNSCFSRNLPILSNCTTEFYKSTMLFSYPFIHLELVIMAPKSFYSFLKNIYLLILRVRLAKRKGETENDLLVHSHNDQHRTGWSQELHPGLSQRGH